MAVRRKGNVVGIRGAHPVGVPARNPEVVAELEALLGRARDGNVAGIAFAAISPMRHLTTGWAGAADRHDMLAAVTILQGRVIRKTLD